MKFTIKAARMAGLLVPMLALASLAFAQVRPLTLSDATEPGSVIVFPKFINAPPVVLPGSTPTATVLAPATELEIGVICPKGVGCAELQPVKIRFHWVCGTTEANLAGSFICQESDFDVTATVFEKIVLVADGTPQNGYASGLPTMTVPAAPCAGGYLIGWVITPASDTPIKFDGLIGDAVVRISGTAQAGYNAIPIQADPSLANGAAVSTNGNGALMFDGAPGHYQAVTGQVLGNVRSGGNAETFLTLLTLDVKSNRPNNPVFVDLDFFGSAEFICWGEVPITANNTGVFVSAPATKVGIFGASDDTGPTTLLGLSETVENFGGQVSFSNLFNSSVPVPTHFLPTPSPNFLP
jgi:hypothetical protein